MPVFNMMQGGGSNSGSSDYGTLPQQITNFYATSGSENVSLFWTNPTDDSFSGTLIVRKTGSYPTKPTDGIHVYSGSNTTYIDTGLMNDTKYYYRAFAYNFNTEYQTIYCVIEVTPKAGQQLSNLPIGAKVKFGTLYSNKLVQVIANQTETTTTLMTDGIVFCGAFDAREPSNSDSNRQNYGNNRILYSNLFQWLNSNANAGQWYSAQHSADEPPSSGYIDTLPYDTLAGYLNQWDTTEIQRLQTVNITVGKHTIDGGGTEQIATKISLPTESNVGLGTEFADGSQFSIFTDNNSRIAKYTTDCVSNRYGTVNLAGAWWLFTPYPSDIYSNSIRYVTNTGARGSNYATSSTTGVRPICYLSPTVLVSFQPDSDGCYTLM